MKKIVELRKKNSGIGITVFSAFLTIIILETILRFTPFNRLILPHKGAYPQHYFKADPTRGYDINENFPKMPAYVATEVEYDIWSNEYGCFDLPFQDNQDYLLLLGDSFTHAFAPFKEKWGTKLEELLEYRVLKCGVSGYGTKQELLKAKEIISKTRNHPALIIVGYYINDFRDDYLFPYDTVISGDLVSLGQIKNIKTGEIQYEKSIVDAYKDFQQSSLPQKLPEISKANNWLKQHSILLNMLIQAIDRIPLPQNWIHFLEDKGVVFYYGNNIGFYNYPWVEKAWVEHLKNLQEFNELARNAHTKLIIVILPSRAQVREMRAGGRSEKDFDLEKPNKLLVDFFKKEGIEHLELLPIFKEYAHSKKKSTLQLFWKSDSHLNLQGNYLVALLVSKNLLEKNLVNVSDSKKKINSINEQLELLLK